jgi:hypothetical protein
LEPTLKITFSGWHAGMKSFRFAQLLHEQAGLGLREAWNIKTKVLNEEPVVLELPASIERPYWSTQKPWELSVLRIPSRPV